MRRFQAAAIIFVTLVAVVPTASVAGEVVPTQTAADGPILDIDVGVAPGGMCDGPVDGQCIHWHDGIKVDPLCTVYTGPSDGSHVGGSDCLHI